MVTDENEPLDEVARDSVKRPSFDANGSPVARGEGGTNAPEWEAASAATPAPLFADVTHVYGSPCGFGGPKASTFKASEATCPACIRIRALGHEVERVERARDAAGAQALREIVGLRSMVAQLEAKVVALVKEANQRAEDDADARATAPRDDSAHRLRLVADFVRLVAGEGK